VTSKWPGCRACLCFGSAKKLLLSIELCAGAVHYGLANIRQLCCFVRLSGFGCGLARSVVILARILLTTTVLHPLSRSTCVQKVKSAGIYTMLFIIIIAVVIGIAYGKENPQTVFKCCSSPLLASPICHGVAEFVLL
jgi:hypothetical protein